MRKMHTEVKLQTENELIERLFHRAELKCLDNLKNFDGDTVLIEGGGYEKIWLETQPMGGEMYAKRNLEVGLNNQLLFMKHQREDGRIPGSIALIDGVVTPQFDKFQGFCFPAPALNLYYLTGRNQDYLEFLYQTLERFDHYLWAIRDSDGDGCLESWCKYDTGEDNAIRYGDAPNAWTQDTPPMGTDVVPMASMDIMSYSYAARETLQEICRILQDNREEFWLRQAGAVKEKIEAYLWNEERGALFDRDRHGVMLPTLTHNNLRAMYWNSMTPRMAQRFVEDHLLNSQEFWTKMPLPSVAANDPLFRNITKNNWSGQVEALTYQRAIRALENYGYYELIPLLGKKLFQAIGPECVFVQQYDPFTMEPSRVSLEGEQDAYGPAMLSVLEYISRLYGIHMEREEIFWGALGDIESTYEQIWGDHVYKIVNHLNGAIAYVDEKEVFRTGAGIRIVTDLDGRIRAAYKYTSAADLTTVRQ